jgi:putative membrane protein
MHILMRIILNAIALYITASLVPGIEYRGGLLQLLFAGFVLGVINLIVRPIVMLLSLPLIILTLGLFYLIVNGLLLWLVSWFVPGFIIVGPISAIVGSLVLGVVNFFLSLLVHRSS